MNISRRILIGSGLSVVTSVMLIFSFHPYNVWFLAFFALIPMLVAQYLIFPPKFSGFADAIGIGGWLFVFLGGMFGGSSAATVIYIVILVIMIIQLFTAPGSHQFHVKTGFRWFVLYGIMNTVGIEMIRSFIPPINTHAFMAQTMYSQPWMIQGISVFSIYGMSFLIVLVNNALAFLAIFMLRSKINWSGIPEIPLKQVRDWVWFAGGSVVIWIGVSAFLLGSAPQNPETIRVAAIQHNYPIPGHLDTPESQPARLAALAEQSRLAVEDNAKLLVWPELGLGFDPQVAYTEEISSLAKELNAWILVGYGLDDPAGWRNEMVMVTPQGEFLDVYGKNHASSPGEPPIISAGVYPVYDTEIGKLGTIICNDVHYTDTSRKLAAQGAQLIAVPTMEIAGIALENTANAVLRAVENRVAVVKADAAFAAAIIDPYGRIIAFRNGKPNGEAFALVADVPLGGSGTLFRYVGDWMGWLCLIGFLAFVVYEEVVKVREKKQAK